MLTKEFTAKTKKGIEITVNAENTEKKLVTNYTVKCVATKQGALHVVSLNKKETKDLLSMTLPAKQKEALIVLENQAEWKRFKDDCLRERYEIEQAIPKTLAEQRKDLVSAEYNLYSPEYFPGSEKWNKWDEATKALKEFDRAYPEVNANVKDVKDEFILTEGGMDL